MEKLSLLVFAILLVFISCNIAEQGLPTNDNTAPVILSAEIYDTNPNELHIMFSEKIIMKNIDGFTITGNSILNIIDYTEYTNNIFIFTIDRDVYRAEKIFLTYNAKNYSNIYDSNNNSLIELDNMQVTNGVGAYNALNGLNSLDQYISQYSGSSSIDVPSLIPIINVGLINSEKNKIISDMINNKKFYIILDYSCGGNYFNDNIVTSQVMSGIIKDNKYIKEIILPLNVISIGSNAFYYCKELKTVILPDGLISIEDHGFYYCDLLENITIPENVLEIGWNAFAHCKTMKNIIIPDNISIIEDMTFEDCYSLSNIKLPSSLKTIKAGAFANCSALQLINLPSGLEKIGGIGAITLDSFQYSGLTEINIPSTVTYVGGDAFANTPINKASMYSQTFIDGNAFYNCKNITFEILGEGNLSTILNNKALVQTIENVSTLISMPSASGHISIPSGINIVGPESFSNCSSLNSIILPNSVIQIGDFAFYRCNNLTSVTLSENLEITGRYSFSNCSLDNILDLFDNSIKM